MRFRFSPVMVWSLIASTALGADSAVWLDVPFTAQEKNGCGAAVLAMVMQYWEREQGTAGHVDVRAIHHELYSRDARGVFASEIQRYLRAHGFRGYAFRGEWNDLKHHLEKGRPLIVALKARGDDLHYVVATGIDPQRQLIFKHDPADRKLMKQHRTEFERGWTRARNWTLLALPDELPAVR
jgi:ABC-type bacteriocin/lantibiotic exporter with double-glycine peptidase domain